MNEVALKNTAAEKKKRELGAADIVFLVLCVLPIIAMIVLKVLFTPQTDGVNIAANHYCLILKQYQRLKF